MHLDLRQLRYFVTVARLEHVGRAADQLNISQSPLSRQIQQLEAQLGLTLFDRERQRIHLTHEGRDFLRDAEALLAHAATLERRAQAVAGGHGGLIRVGFVEGAVYAAHLPRIAKAWRQRYPKVEVEFELLRSHRQHQALTDRSLDIGFAYTAASRTDLGLSASCLGRDSFILAGPEDHPAFRDPARADPDALDGADFITPPLKANPRFQAGFLRASADYGFVPTIRYEVEEEARIYAMAAAGAGVTLAQKAMRSLGLPGLAFADLPDFDLSVAIYLLWREQDQSALVRNFVEIAGADSC